MRKLVKPKVLWAACLSATLISGICIYRAVFRGVGGSELALSTKGDPVVVGMGAANSSLAAVREVEDAVASAASVVATYAPSDIGKVEDEGLRRAVPPPAGPVLENARAVFADISSDILVRERVRASARYASGDVDVVSGLIIPGRLDAAREAGCVAFSYIAQVV